MSCYILENRGFKMGFHSNAIKECLVPQRTCHWTVKITSFLLQCAEYFNNLKNLFLVRTCRGAMDVHGTIDTNKVTFKLYSVKNNNIWEFKSFRKPASEYLSFLNLSFSVYIKKVERLKHLLKMVGLNCVRVLKAHIFANFQNNNFDVLLRYFILLGMLSYCRFSKILHFFKFFLTGIWSHSYLYKSMLYFFLI